MSLFLLGFSAYLTYYTFTYGLKVWKQNKFSAVSVFMVSISFLPLTIWVEYLK